MGCGGNLDLFKYSRLEYVISGNWLMVCCGKVNWNFYLYCIYWDNKKLFFGSFFCLFLKCYIREIIIDNRNR